MQQRVSKQGGLLASTALGALMIIGLANPALAGAPTPLVDQSSHVEDNGGAENSPGVYTYEFTVFNDGQAGLFTPEYGYASFVNPIIVDWELPYFADAAITNIVDPFGWSHTIETVGTANPLTGWDGVANWQDPNDPFYFPNSPFSDVTQVLHWYLDDWVNFGDPTDGIHATDSTVCQPPSEVLVAFAVSITPCNALAGFAFDSIYPATAAPYQASWASLPVRTGDPAFPTPGGSVPFSPTLQAAAVPEPESIGLLATGLIGLGAWLSRRKRRAAA